VEDIAGQKWFKTHFFYLWKNNRGHFKVITTFKWNPNKIKAVVRTK
jgi:hypothetical protein